MPFDADGAVDREPAGPAPDPPSACVRHVRSRGGVLEPAPREPAQDASLYSAGHGLRVSGSESGGLVEADSALDVVGGHAVEGWHVEVSDSGD